MSETKISQPEELRNPDSQASINAMIQKAVQESLGQTVAIAVKAAVEGMLPAFQKMALSPDALTTALKEGLKPYVDPAKVAREKRESQNSREQLEDMRRNEAEARARCSHTDKNGNDSISLVHNFPDRQVRGVCMICRDWINPSEWTIPAPDPVTGKSKPYVRPAHKDYARVLRLESMS